MARIVVLGGTGYAGRHIVAEAVARGHAVTVVSRTGTTQPVDGASYRTADLLDPQVVATAVADHEVVVVALSPRGALDGRMREVVGQVAAAVQAARARLGVVGGAGSLQVAPGGPLLVETPEFGEAYRSEARQLTGVLDDLRASDPALDWFFVSPAAAFGAHAEGRHTGTFRIGDDVLLTAPDGTSAISGADLAQAFVDEIEHPAHHRARFTVAY